MCCFNNFEMGGKKMATFDRCPRCGNNEDSARIWVCRDCGCVHCEECDPDGGICPACEGRHMKNIGYVDSE